MNDGYKYNWDEMVEIAFHINEHSVEEQIDETDIRKIPQIVCAESGSLTVPV